MLSLSDVYQLRQQLSNCALPLSDADFGIFASRLQALMASLDDGGQQYQQHQTTDAQSFPIADTPLRRSLLATLWRFVQLDWIHNKFKHLGHPLSLQICTFIFVGMRNATFTNDKIWFGGVSRIRTFASADLAVHSEQRRRHSSPISAADDRTPMRQNSFAYFALGLTLIGFQEDIEEIVPFDNLRQFLTKLDEMFCASSNIFMDALLENDERCLQTMAAIQRINSNTKNIFCTNSLDVPTALAPDILALSLLRKIHFDPLVVIDWVSSEPELSFVFLKQFSHRLAQLQPHELLQLCAAYVKMPNSESVVAAECRFEIVRQPTNSSTTTAQQHNDDDQNFMHFEIDELHGQQIVRKSVAVPTQTNHLSTTARHGLFAGMFCGRIVPKSDDIQCRTRAEIAEACEEALAFPR
uniref:ELMO domain-containing protein n=1 Tax=Globodera pallida TaxID=36090 RepID=A0A183BZU4_GLOPA